MNVSDQQVKAWFELFGDAPQSKIIRNGDYVVSKTLSDMITVYYRDKNGTEHAQQFFNDEAIYYDPFGENSIQAQNTVFDEEQQMALF